MDVSANTLQRAKQASLAEAKENAVERLESSDDPTRLGSDVEQDAERARYDGVKYSVYNNMLSQSALWVQQPPALFFHNSTSTDDAGGSGGGGAIPLTEYPSASSTTAAEHPSMAHSTALLPRALNEAAARELQAERALFKATAPDADEVWLV